MQDTLNEQEGAASIFDEPPSPREERVPPLDLHPIDQRYNIILCHKSVQFLCKEIICDV